VLTVMALIINNHSDISWNISATLLMISIIISLIINFVIFYCFSKVEKTVFESLVKWALLTIFVCVIDYFFVGTLKNIFQRPRFRNIFNDETNTLKFKSWYELKLHPQNPASSSKTKSFPSAHTSYASSLYSLLFLPWILKNSWFKKHSLFLRLFIFLLITITAFSRIMSGAHYLSDVLFGTAIVFVSFLLVQFLFFKQSKQTLCKIIFQIKHSWF
jgi:membrane-associated phospholipid phosphatase